MTVNSVNNLLSEYKNRALPLLDVFFREKIQKAKEIGDLPSDVLTNIHALVREGKMIRGYLMTLGYELAGGKDTDSILDASIFMEIVQTGILVHDDIMDEDDLRRGMKTLHIRYKEYGKKLRMKPSATRFGESMAICGGDLAFYLSWEKLLYSKFPDDLRVLAGRIYCDFFIRLAYGQIFDVASSGKEPTIGDIQLTYLLKTGEYTGALPLITGAVLARSSDAAYLENLKIYGINLGLIFQIRDDILGLYGDTNKTGKSASSDIREGKYTMLVAHFMSHAEASDLKKFRSYFGKNTLKPHNITEVKTLIEKTGSIDYLQKQMQNCSDGIQTVIPKITKNTELQNRLNDLAEFAMKRDK